MASRPAASITKPVTTNLPLGDPRIGSGLDGTTTVGLRAAPEATVPGPIDAWAGTPLAPVTAMSRLPPFEGDAYFTTNWLETRWLALVMRVAAPLTPEVSRYWPPVRSARTCSDAPPTVAAGPSARVCTVSLAATAAPATSSNDALEAASGAPATTITLACSSGWLENRPVARST